MDKVNSILSAWELQRANRLDEYLSLQVRNGQAENLKAFRPSSGGSKPTEKRNKKWA